MTSIGLSEAGFSIGGVALRPRAFALALSVGEPPRRSTRRASISSFTRFSSWIGDVVRRVERRALCSSSTFARSSCPADRWSRPRAEVDVCAACIRARKSAASYFLLTGSSDAAFW